jgi:hypothetical protein
MGLRKRLRLLVTALFNPRKAVTEGLYNGRVIKSKWLLAYRLVATMLSSVVYEPLAMLMKDGLFMPFLFATAVVAVIASEYWLFPRLLLFSLTPHTTTQLAKREKRGQRSNTCITFEICRQIVLFSQLAMSIAFLPITIFSIIFTLKLYLAYVGIFASLIWLYIVIYPTFSISRKKAIFKILSCYLFAFLISTLAFVLVVFIYA